MASPTYKKKFIAFVDIIGFKERVKKAENQNKKISYDEVYQIKNILNGDGLIEDFLCELENYENGIDFFSNDLDFVVTQISDCVIVSSEYSSLGLLSIINFFKIVSHRLLRRFVMVRGYITEGNVWHIPTDIIGTGYQKAYQNESQVTARKLVNTKSAPPVIEIDRNVVEYMDQLTNSVVRKWIECAIWRNSNDAKECVIDPFKVYLASNPQTPDEIEKLRYFVEPHIEKCIKEIYYLLNDDVSEQGLKAKEKVEHYIAFLNDVKTKLSNHQKMIEDAFGTPYPAHSMSDILGYNVED